jgi:hypothetical protein
VGFDRQAVGAAIWRGDPGATLSGQRIRAWAALAVADAAQPDVLVTTSRAVIENLLESHGDALRFERLADIRVSVPPAGRTSLLSGVLADLANRESLTTADLSAITSPVDDAATGPAVSVTFFGAANRTPATVIRRIAPAALAPTGENETAKPVRNTLILLMES